MSTTTLRIRAIRTTLDDLVSHINQFIGAVDNIHGALHNTEDSKILQKVFSQLKKSLIHLACHVDDFSRNANGDPDEIMRLYHIDKSLRTHVARALELVQNVQKIYRTASLDHATSFALINTEIMRIRRAGYTLEEIYVTLNAHYTDTEGKITHFLESSKKYKRIDRVSENTIWYLDLYDEIP